MASVTQRSVEESSLQQRRIILESCSEFFRYIRRIGDHKRPYRSMWILISFIFIALVADERLVRFIHNRAVRDFLYSFTYVGKWEFVSLLTMCAITYIYWRSQTKNPGELDSRYFATANFCIIASLVLLVCAIITLALTPLGVVALYAHLIFVILVALAFLLNDLVTWQGMEKHEIKLRGDIRDESETLELLRDNSRIGERSNIKIQQVEKRLSTLRAAIAELQIRKNEYRFSMMAADIPMCCAFIVLFLFMLIHPLEHWWFHRETADLMKQNPIPYFLEKPLKKFPVISIEASTEYFIGGAIAFQFLVSTAAYIMISFGVLQSASHVSEGNS